MASKSAIIILITGLALITFSAKSQDSLSQRSVNFNVKPTYLAGMLLHTKNSILSGKSMVIDSLTKELLLVKSKNDSLLLLLSDEVAQVGSLQRDVSRFNEENQNLAKELDLAKGDQLQTSHTSSILLIFNIIAGIILLVALLWIFNRKKGDVIPSSESGQHVKIATMATADVMEKKMERIEKLGKLRDKGLLTEEEFLSQKKHILG